MKELGESRSRAGAQREDCDSINTMPPGPAYNWLCVLHSTAEILSHAARHRTTQIIPKSSSPLNSRKRRRTEETVDTLVSVDHARSEEKSCGHESIVNASSITQNVDIQA